ncbi:MAG: head decoration protein [Proteobacteria bacterium]|nr:head decoration protein [Pseudomonadota bacterium]MBU4381573.1 head decoration protein [Pseudomonadota bacterium]MCG2766559.1 head decoration protein [Desulfarculaceae bacterium]
MARNYGVTSDSLTPVALEGGHPIITKPGTLLSGENAAKGQVLGQDADGKYVNLDLEPAVADEVLVADAGGSLKVFEGLLVNPGVIPGSVTIGATVGAAAKEMTDDGKGGLAGAGVGFGFIDYASGYYRLIFTTAPDDDSAITAGYSHDAAGKAKAAAVAPEAVDASSADEAGVFIVHGEVYKAALVWPDSITDAQKARTLEQLETAGVYASAVTGA